MLLLKPDASVEYISGVVELEAWPGTHVAAATLPSLAFLFSLLVG